MLWWTYQQLRVSNPKTRLATVEKLTQSEHSDSVEPLLFALRDEEAGVRSAAARGLGRFQDRRAVEPLMQMLRDPAPLARAAAAEALGQLGDAQAVNWLVRLLRDVEPTVRARALQSLKQLGWQPDSDTDRALQLMATGTLRQVAALGTEAIGPLVELLRHFVALRDESHRGGVHAVAQTGGRRAVVEDVAEMSPARATRDLRALHRVRAVGA